MYSGEPQTVRAICNGSSARTSPKSPIRSRAPSADEVGVRGAAAEEAEAEEADAEEADADAAGIHGLRRYVGESAGFVCKTSRF